MAPMTFRFENIGPVDRADLTLGDLTIVAGRNNTGKTYLVYALYGFLQHLEAWPSAPSRFALPPHGPSRQLTTLIGHVTEELTASGRASVPATRDELAALRRQLVNLFARKFSATTLPAVFSSPPELFREARVSVDLGRHEPTTELDEPADLALPGASLSYDGRELAFSMNLRRSSSRPNLSEVALGNTRNLLFRFLCFSFPRPFIVSSERFGISLFYKELDFTKSQLVDVLQKLGREGNRSSQIAFLLIDKATSRYAQPIKDNIDYTRNIHDMQKRRGPLSDHKLFDDIKDVMGGYYKASPDVISFRSKTRGKRKFDIPLHLASSSARGLTDLYFYLRHQATRNDLLIIDEPESHLDTRNQILLARMLARFVGAGIRVLITTHSDYVIKEINNLIMLSHVDDNGILQDLNYMDADRLDASSVRAYVAEKNQLLPADVDEFGINMPTFDDTIDDINRTSRTLAAAVRA